MSLTFGRGEDRDIRIGWNPEDCLVSRCAGTLHATADGVQVRNESSTQEIYLLPIPGREVPVGPGRMVGLPDPWMYLLVLGLHGARYEIVLDRRAWESSTGSPSVGPAGGKPTITRSDSLAPRELRMLAALCEPLLLFAGEDARAATYAEIADRLGLRPAYVRRCLADLRDRLSGGEGMPRLRPDDDGGTGRGFGESLADWAIRSGTVTLRIVTELDQGPR